jgi:hypothetical protein
MIESETSQPEDEEAPEGIESGEETPDFGDRPESPEPGYPVSETEPHEGMPDRGHEHPEEIPSPTGEEGEQDDTTSAAGPPDADSGGA